MSQAAPLARSTRSARSLVAGGLVVALAGCASHIPRPEFERFDIRVTPDPDGYPDVQAVNLLDRGTLQLTVDPISRSAFGILTRYRRFKVLREGAEDLRRIVIPYDPGSAIATLIVQTVAPNGHTRSGGETQDGTDVSGRPAKIVTVAEAPPGTVVEYAYCLYLRDLRFVPPWVFQSAIPTIRSEYAVVAPPGFQVDLRFSREGTFIDHPPDRFETDDGTRYFWSESNLPARFSEPGAPSADLLAPRAHFIFLGATLGGHETPGFASWEDVATWFTGRVPNWATLKPETVAEAKRISGETSVEEKALKLLTVVARDLPPEPGSATPLWASRLVHPDQVLREKRANPTSRGLLLCALLRAIGLPAVPALVAYRDRGVLLPDLPTAYELDAVVAVVPRNEGPLVLDPSQLTVSADVPSPRLQGTRIVAIREANAEVMTVPTSLPGDSRSALAYDLRLDERGDLTGTLEARLTGAEAGTLRRLLLSADPGAYADIVSAFTRERGGGPPVESASIADLVELRRPLVVKGTISVRRAAQGEETRLNLPLAQLVGSSLQGARLREVRRSPLKVGAPREAEVTVTVSMPESYELETIPQPFAQSWPGGEVSIKVRAEGKRRIGVLRKSMIKVHEVAPDQYGAFRRLEDAIAEAERQNLAIKRPAARSPEY